MKIRPPRSLCLFIFCALLVLTGCAEKQPSHTPTPSASAAQTRTPSSTATFTPTISPTSRSSPTATVAPTWTPQPTNTPLVPTPARGQSYQLTNWTPEKAEQLIKELKAYQETLFGQTFVQLAYMAYQYAGLAELESALRFPQLDQKKGWQWDGAYQLYLSNNDDIGSLYASLITGALNQRETNLEDLVSWFTNTTHFSLDTYPVTPPKDYAKSVVLHIYCPEDIEVSSGFVIWLLQKEGKYFAYPLKNEWEISYKEGHSEVDFVDITGDGIEEVILQNANWQSFNVHNGALAIYRLDQVPPQRIEFDTPLYDEATADWVVIPGSPVPTITFHLPVAVETGSPCQPVITGWQYRWQDGMLKLIKYVPPFGEARTMMEERPMCARILVDILGAPRYLEKETVLAAYKQMLDLPFLSKDMLEWERPFSIEKKRLAFALYLSNTDDEVGAAEQMKLMQASTDPTMAQWRKDAADLYAVYRDRQALLNYCLTSAKCGQFLDQNELIGLIPASRLSDAEVLLRQMGNDYFIAGTEDFDLDGQPEKWLFFQGSYSCDHRFLILAWVGDAIKTRSPFSMLCLSTEDGEVVKDIEIKRSASSGELPEYYFVIDGNETSDKFLYWPMDQQDPTIGSPQAKRMIDVIHNRLMLGSMLPDEARAQLLGVKNVTLEPGWMTLDFQIQRLYLIALTYELTGERAKAAQTYLELWQTFPDNAYAIMARAKLEAVK